MRSIKPRHRRSSTGSGMQNHSALRIAALVAVTLPLTAIAQRPMTWLDMQNMRQLGSAAPSPDGKSLLYTLTTPNWQQARRQSDIYLVDTQRGVQSTRQLTYTKDKNESNPAWSADGRFFVFLSDRDAATGTNNANRPSTLPASGPGAPYFPPAVGAGRGGATYQLYLMRPDGGEARRITDAHDGVSTFAFSSDGKWLVYRSGSATKEQLYALPVTSLAAGDSVRASQITRHPTGVGLWRWAPDSRRIYFVTADTVDPDEQLRLEKHFDVRIRNMEVPVSSLWSVDVTTHLSTRLTRDTSYSVGDFVISDDGKWVGYHGISTNRFQRNILEQMDYADLYLLEIASGNVERLTNNADISESEISFSPDSKTVAFAAPDDFTFMHNARVYLRPAANRGGKRQQADRPRRLGLLSRRQRDLRDRHRRQDHHPRQRADHRPRPARRRGGRPRLRSRRLRSARRGRSAHFVMRIVGRKALNTSDLQID